MTSSRRLSFCHLVSVLALSVLLVACGKSATISPTTPTIDANTVALTSGTWIRSKWEVKQSDGTWLSLPLTTYQKSIMVTYKADYSVTLVAASNLGGTTTSTGTWKFTNNETTIVETYANATSPTTTDIGTLTPTLFQEKEYDGPYSLPDANGIITTYAGVRFTWSH